MVTKQKAFTQVNVFSNFQDYPLYPEKFQIYGVNGSSDSWVSSVTPIPPPVTAVGAKTLGKERGVK